MKVPSVLECERLDELSYNNCIGCLESEDVESESEEQCVSRSLDDSQRLELTIDIVLHPTFSVPTPFFSLSYSSGSSLSLENVIKCVSEVRSSSFTSSEMHFSNRSPLGSFEPDIHPFLGRTTVSIHLCSLVNRLNDFVNDSMEVYCLNWWSIMGPYLGFPLHPSQFVRAMAMVEKEVTR